MRFACLVTMLGGVVGGVVVVELADPDTQQHPVSMDFLAAGLPEVLIQPTRDRSVIPATLTE